MRAIIGFLAAATVIFAVGCGQPAIERLAEARRLTAELLVQFNKASDATDRVVMAAAEDTSASFAEQAEQAHAAVDHLDRFMSLNAQIVSLSRRNSNVLALALALGEKGALASRCEDLLRALQDSLAKRGSSGTR